VVIVIVDVDIVVVTGVIVVVVRMVVVSGSLGAKMTYCNSRDIVIAESVKTIKVTPMTLIRW
jgi:hypothetical protein